jgi:hypothetical protein
MTFSALQGVVCPAVVFFSLILLPQTGDISIQHEGRLVGTIAASRTTRSLVNNHLVMTGKFGIVCGHNTVTRMAHFREVSANGYIIPIDDGNGFITLPKM